MVRAKPRSGVSSPDFDGKPSGARYIGAGESGAALSGSPESPLWNPASLADVSGSFASANFDVARQSLLDDEVVLRNVSLRGRKLTYLGFATTGGAFFFRPMASFQERTVTNPADPVNNFRDRALKINQFGISASQEGEKGAHYGITLSFINARLALGEAAAGSPPRISLADGNGFSFDLGFRVRKEYLRYGLAFHNIPGILYWNAYEADQLPVLLRTGVAFYPVPMFGFVADYDKRFYRGDLPRPSSTHLGMELALASWLQLRGGSYGEDLSDPDKTAYAAGFSVSSPKIHRLDFALRSYRVLGERVYNYFITILLPMAEGERSSGGSFSGNSY